MLSQLRASYDDFSNLGYDDEIHITTELRNAATYLLLARSVLKNVFDQKPTVDINPHTR
jgi:hypothetical protein